MKNRLRLFLVAVLALGLLAAASAAVTAAAPGPQRPRVVTSWPFTPPYGSFAEGMTLGFDGNLYVSLTTWGDVNDTGQIVQVNPCGGQTPFGPSLDLGFGLLTGVAFDGVGNLYVAEAFSDTPGVFRVPASGPAVQVLSLPADSFPNGIAFHDGYMYVTDSSYGAVWKSDPTQYAAPGEPWLQDALLTPGSGPRDHEIGANGIAFSGADLYVSVSDGSRIVRVMVQADGSAGPVSTVLERATLHAADGIAFDGTGTLWIATNGPNQGQVLTLTPGGKLGVAAVQAGLDYPTMPVLGPDGSLYVENGSFDGGAPSVVALR